MEKRNAPYNEFSGLRMESELVRDLIMTKVAERDGNIYWQSKFEKRFWKTVHFAEGLEDIRFAKIAGRYKELMGAVN